MQEQDILIKNLGLTDKEAAVYMAILELGSSTIKPIATQSGVKRTSIYYFIENLVNLGIVEQAKIRGRYHYKALPPENLVSLQQHRLKELEEALPQFRSYFNESTSKPKISYYEGVEQLQNIMLEELKCKSTSFIWPASVAVEMVGGTDFMQKLIKRMAENKVKNRILRFPDQDLEYPGSVGGALGPYRQLRFAPKGLSFPVAIGIFDPNKVAFMTSKKEGFGIIIESPEVHEAMTFLFNMFWEQSEVREGYDK